MNDDGGFHSQREVFERQRAFRAIAENASEAIIVIDAASTIVYLNAAAGSTFGHSPERMLRMPFAQLMPERLRSRHQAGMERYLASGERRIPWNGIELPGLHASGREIPLEVTFSEFELHGERFFTGIMRDVSERKAAERLREELNEELEARVRARTEEFLRANERLRAEIRQREALQRDLEVLRWRLVEQREEERASLGRELHDEVLQRILALNMDLPDADDPQELRAAFRRELRGIAQSVRRTLRGMQPPALEELGLRRALEHFVGGIDARDGAPVVELALRHTPALPPPLALALYRAAQEAIWNAVKHAGASCVRVTLAERDGFLELNVFDDGCGFRVPQRLTEFVRRDRFGLASLREHLAALGGEVRVTSVIGEGSTVSVVVPLVATPGRRHPGPG